MSVWVITGKKPTKRYRVRRDPVVPKELRKLTFPQSELRAAVYDYCLRANIMLPNAPIERVDVPGGDEPFITIYFMEDEDGNHRTFDLSRDQVGAALIKFSSTNSIPLPRTAQKVIKAEGDSVSMMVNVLWETKV